MPRPLGEGLQGLLREGRSIRVLAVAAVCLAASAARAGLTDTENELVAAVKARSPQALELLERSVRQNSGTLNVEGVRAAGEIFRAELDALGFKTRWVDMPEAMRRAGHVVAEREGKQGQRVLLMGHIDTVFDKESPVAAWDPRGARVRGQGVVDMKGGNVAMLEALRAMKAVGVLDGTTIRVILTGDEERMGSPRRAARAPAVELAKQSDAALSFEASSRMGAPSTANIARRAAGGWTLRVKARSGHSSRVFTRDLGNGAIYEGARILEAFRTQVAEPGLTLNPGLAMGGTEAFYDGATASGTALGKNNVIAGEMIVRGDLRFVTPEQGERAKAKMRDIVAASLPYAEATIRFTESYPAMPETEGSRRLLEVYSRVSEDAGFGPVTALDPEERGAGDVQFVAPHVPVLDGLGVSGSGAHTVDEDMEIASLERGAIRAAILIHRLTRPSP